MAILRFPLSDPNFRPLAAFSEVSYMFWLLCIHVSSQAYENILHVSVTLKTWYSVRVCAHIHGIRLSILLYYVLSTILKKQKYIP